MVVGFKPTPTFTYLHDQHNTHVFVFYSLHSGINKTVAHTY
jgi:hypothetical protein